MRLHYRETNGEYIVMDNTSLIILNRGCVNKSALCKLLIYIIAFVELLDKACRIFLSIIFIVPRKDVYNNVNNETLRIVPDHKSASH